MRIIVGIVKLLGGIVIAAVAVFMFQLDPGYKDDQYQKETKVAGQTVSTVTVSGDEVRAEALKTQRITAGVLGAFGLFVALWGIKDFRD